MTTPPRVAVADVSLPTIARQWLRLGCIGFGGPPAHIALLRRLCVERHHWLQPDEFEDGIAATNLLPGPASTQLAILCAWHLRGIAGAVVGGIGFILPGFLLILGLSVLLLAAHPPLAVLGAAAGAGAAVPAVALHAASRLLPGSWSRAQATRAGHGRWVVYLLAGGVAAALAGPFLVVVLVACGLCEWLVRRAPGMRAHSMSWVSPLAVVQSVTAGTAGSIAWVAFKVGALSYGGGFVIVPLMQHDVVDGYHWLSAGQFLDAIALGQVTPGPVVLTVAAIGYAAAGIGGAVLATVVAFTPSFVIVGAGAPHLESLRRSPAAQAFLTGAGASVIGAIVGAAVPLALALHAPWQAGVLGGALLWLLAARRGVVSCLLFGGAVGTLVAVTAGL